MTISTIAAAKPLRLAIGPVPGYTPAVGRLVSFMSYVRRGTIGAIYHLTPDELDYVHDGRSNTIGALLSHIIAMELRAQARLFGENEQLLAELEEWSAGLALWDRARDEMRGFPLEKYRTALGRARTRTLMELTTRTDEWLEELLPPGKAIQTNRHRDLLHLAEDELCHRGQINWIVIRMRDLPA